MRKILSVVLIGFIVLWTYNIFIDNIIVLEKPEEEPYRGMIRILDISRPDMNINSTYSWMADKIRAFEKRNAGVYIEYVQADMESIYNAIVNGNVEENEMPDIIPVDANFFDFNLLEPLDEYLKEDEIEEFKHQILKSVTYKDQIVAIPVAMSSNVMLINLDRFNERGVSPPLGGDWTYDEFVDTLKRLKYDSDGDGIIDEYGFISSIETNRYYIWPIILSDGGEFINPKRREYNFYGEKAIKGLEKVIALKEKYDVVPDYFGIIDERDAWQMFYQDRKAAIYITGAWAVRFLDSQYKSGEGFNFDVVNFPIGDKNLPVILSDDIIAYGVLKDEDPKKVEMCVNLLKHLTTERNQRTLETLGLFTVRRNIEDMYTDNPKMKKIEQILNYTIYVPFVDYKSEIDAIANEEIRKAIMGEKSSSEAIEDAKTEIDRLTNKNND